MPSPATTGGERTGIAGTRKTPVLAPVSVAVASSRSPFGPVMTTVRVSTRAGSALHAGASARRKRLRPITPQTVGEAYVASTKLRITLSGWAGMSASSKSVRSCTTSAPTVRPVMTSVVVFVGLVCFARFASVGTPGARTSSSTRMLSPGPSSRDQPMTTGVSVESTTPGIEPRPATGLSM